MARDFTPPKTDTRTIVNPVDLAYMFRLQANFDARRIEQTPRGGRAYRAITGGNVEGPRLTAAVYPDSGGDYGQIRADGVEDVMARFMLRAANGEWIYVSHTGYRRPDGYHRLHAWFDADAGGPYAWLNDAVVLVHAAESANGRSATFTYHQAI